MINSIKAIYHVMHDIKLPEVKKKELISRRLKKVLISAYLHVPYYREMMNKIGYDPVKNYNGLNDLKNFPVISKKDIKENDISMFLREGVEMKRLFLDHTSGSTGIPLEVYFSRYEKAFITAKWLRVLFLNGYSIRDRYFTVTSSIRNDLDKSIIQKLGFLRKMNITYDNSPEKIADLFLDYKPQVIWGTRAYLEILANELIKRKAEPTNLKILISGAEIITKHNKDLFKQAFGLNTTEIYGSVETGVTAYETPEHDGMHLCDDLTYFEFLDEKNKEAKQGEPARIIVTDLIGTTMPFIRYDLGDLAIIKIVKDKNGKSVTRITKIIGRDDDYVYIPGNRRLFIHDFDSIIYGFKDIKQFRVIQKSKNHLVLNIASTEKYFQEIKEQVREKLSKILPEDFTYDLEWVDSIRPEYTGKLKMIISDLPLENSGKKNKNL